MVGKKTIGKLDGTGAPLLSSEFASLPGEPGAGGVGDYGDNCTTIVFEIIGPIGVRFAVNRTGDEWEIGILGKVQIARTLS